jgi:propanol-preferring alcohol dehydrogenase
MKALILEKPGSIFEHPLSLVELATPEPLANEVLIRVSACGLCRTDLHIIEGELAAKKLPIVPGHQVVGKIVKMGSSCRRFSLGDRIGIAWLRSTCAECEFCRAGQENLCQSSLYTGYHADGGYAEYAAVPEDYAYLIPEIFSDAQATPLLCAGIIGYRALRRSELKAGQKLAIFGFGSSAHITLQVAQHRQCEVYVATRGQSHQQLARAMGASWVGDTFDKLPSLVDSAIVFAPVGEIVPIALRALKSGGTVALAGIYSTPIPEMSYDQHLFHEKNLRSVEANTRQDGIEFLREAAQIPLKPKVTIFPLDQANEALCRLKRDEIDGTGVLLI